MNILLIVIDALRPDHLGFNSYHRDTSPNIDQFSKESTVFSNAYTVLPRTAPAIASLLTGLYPHSHGIRLISNKGIDPLIPTITRTLRSHGYTTLFLGGGGISKDGLEQGFDYYDPLLWKIRNKIKRNIHKFISPDGFMGSSQQHIETAIRWLKHNSSKNFFLVLHCNDIHWPYLVPPPFDHMFDPDYEGAHDFNTLISRKYTRGDIVFGNVKLPKKEINHAIAHYDGGIRYTDFHLGRLFQAVKDKEVYENTLIIIMSDHGEHLGEHNFYFHHGSSIYEPSIRIPLIFHNPRIIQRGKEISSKVQIIDIMPTILDILGIPLIDKIDGASLLPLIKEQKKEIHDFIFAETSEEHIKGHKRIFFGGNKGKWRMIIEGDWKMIYIPNSENDIFELYNLRNDSWEKNNLIGKEKEIASHMKNKILEFLKLQDNEGDANISDLTEKSKKLLRKLGYLD